MSRNYACLTFRTRKARCDRSPQGDTSARCSICVKLGRDCVFPTPSPEILWPSDEAERNGRETGMRSVDTTTRGLPLFSELERINEVATILSSTCHDSVERLLSQLEAQFELADHDATLCVGPFGILRVEKRQNADEQGLEACEIESMNPTWEELILDVLPTEDVTFFGFEPGTIDDSSAQLGSHDAREDSPLLTFNPGSGSYEAFPTLVHTRTPLPTTDIQLLTSAIPQPQTNMLEEYTADLADVDARSIRLLLNHYQGNMIPAFAPVQALPKSLWQLVHIPRVHETLGEILIRGDASNSRVALFFAILSAASFHSDNTGHGLNRYNQMPWRKLGEIFRQRARTRLVSSLKTLSGSGGGEEYKDMLLALLSMVTVCVVSGDMVEAYAYLRDVDRLISLHGQSPCYRSRSIRMLHSSFLYLWTLQASVRVFSDNTISEDMLRSTHHTGVWGKLLESDSPLESASGDSDDDMSPDGPSFSSSVFEQVYSVPEALFRLIGRVTSLHQRIEQDGVGGPAMGCLPYIAKEISDLENEICSWKNDTAVQDFPHNAPGDLLATWPGRTCPEATAVRYHFRAAVHAAILIFFYKCIRKVDTYTVQPFVERTARSLQLYAQAKRACGDESSSICWPAFIAGCEALEPELRQLMSRWFETETAQTGIKMFEIAGKAARDVWAARDLAGDRNLPWSEILKRDNTLDRLVLS